MKVPEAIETCRWIVIYDFIYMHLLLCHISYNPFFFADDPIIIVESLPHLRTDIFRMPRVIMKCQPAGKRNSGRPLTSLLHCNTETAKGHETCPWKHDNDDDDIRQGTLRKKRCSVYPCGSNEKTTWSITHIHAFVLSHGCITPYKLQVMKLFSRVKGQSLYPGRKFVIIFEIWRRRVNQQIRKVRRSKICCFAVTNTMTAH